MGSNGETESYDFEKFNDLSIKEKVRIEIWNAVLSGKLVSGERILESKIAKQMSVSRAPVREAVRQLEGEGLVTVIPRKGVFVAELTLEDIEDIYFVRSVIEEYAVGFFLQNKENKDIKELKKLIEEMKKAIKENNLDKLSQIDVKFHELIVLGSKHKKLHKIWTTLKPHIWTLNSLVRSNKITLKEIVKLHSKIVKDLESNNVSKARKTIRSHVNYFGNILVKSLKKKNNP